LRRRTRQVDARPPRFDSPIQFNVRDDISALGYERIRSAALRLALFVTFSRADTSD